MITPIERLDAISGLEQPKPQTSAEVTGDSLFGAVFQNAINNVREADAEKGQAQYLLATGQLDNPAALTVASAKSELAISLLVQLRNKALEAYQEMTRISM